MIHLFVVAFLFIILFNNVYYRLRFDRLPWQRLLPSVVNRSRPMLSAKLTTKSETLGKNKGPTWKSDLKEYRFESLFNLVSDFYTAKI
jgi:hypothetical protein